MDSASTRSDDSVFVQEVFPGQGWILKNFLSKEECKSIISEADSTGFDLKYSGTRLCLRQVSENDSLAKAIFQRILPHLPPTVQATSDEDEDEVQGVQNWKLHSLNSQFRICKYTAGHKFGAHVDYSTGISKKIQSFYTLMVYLNNHSEFEGGSTRFLDKKYPVEVKPETGLCLLFRQDVPELLHEGEEVKAGTKYILRTDVLYEKVEN